MASADFSWEVEIPWVKDKFTISNNGSNKRLETFWQYKVESALEQSRITLANEGPILPQNSLNALMIEDLYQALDWYKNKTEADQTNNFFQDIPRFT